LRGGGVEKENQREENRRERRKGKGREARRRKKRRAEVKKSNTFRYFQRPELCSAENSGKHFLLLFVNVHMYKGLSYR
jgi:hypothetical protein